MSPVQQARAVASKAAIWKFELRPDLSEVTMPRGARPLHVACQGDAFMLWAQVDPDAPTAPRWFRVVGTGHPFDEDTVKAYVGTVHYPVGGLIFHVLEVIHG
jgi:hypothetical protein